MEQTALWKSAAAVGAGLGEGVVAALELAKAFFGYPPGTVLFLYVDDGTPRWVFEGRFSLPGAGTDTLCQLIMVNGGSFDVRRLEGGKFVPVVNATAHLGILEARRLAQSLPEINRRTFGIGKERLCRYWEQASLDPGAVVCRLRPF